MKGTITTSAEEPIQAIYNPKGTFFNVVGGKFEGAQDGWEGLNHPARYCNDTCTDMTAHCCHTDDGCTGAECLENCNCYGSHENQAEDTYGPPMSPYMKAQMEDDDRYWSSLDILCYNNGANSLGSPPTRENPDVGSGVTHHLFDGYLGHVFMEQWWERADCEGWFLPDPLCAPRDCGAGNCQSIQQDPVSGALGISNIVPKFWFFGCSGVPIFSYSITRARDNGDITATECTDLLGQLGATSSGTDFGNPSQAILRKLWNAGYIRTSDWRKELNDAWSSLSSTYSAYSSCTVTDPADLDVVGPCRILGDGITCADAYDSDIQPGCCIDPWSGGPYPEEGDSDWGEYETWRGMHGVYVHARRGGWGWACWSATESNIPFVGAARNNFDCLEKYGYPQDTCCTASACSGDFPTLCCESPCGEEPPCYNPDAGCIAQESTLESCDSTVVRGFCDGVAISSFVYKQKPYLVQPAGGDPYIAYRSVCHQTYHSCLQAIDNSCGDWSTPSELYECRASDDGLGVYATFPQEDDTHFAPMTYCDFISGGTTMDDACCGALCADWDAPVSSGVHCPDIWGTADGCTPNSAPRADNDARDCIGERGACLRGTTCYDFIRQKECIALGGTYYSQSKCCEGEDYDPPDCIE